MGRMGKRAGQGRGCRPGLALRLGNEDGAIPAFLTPAWSGAQAGLCPAEPRGGQCARGSRKKSPPQQDRLGDGDTETEGSVEGTPKKE